MSEAGAAPIQHTDRLGGGEWKHKTDQTEKKIWNKRSNVQTSFISLSDETRDGGAQAHAITHMHVNDGRNKMLSVRIRAHSVPNQAKPEETREQGGREPKRNMKSFVFHRVSHHSHRTLEGEHCSYLVQSNVYACYVLRARRTEGEREREELVVERRTMMIHKYI